MSTLEEGDTVVVHFQRSDSEDTLSSYTQAEMHNPDFRYSCSWKLYSVLAIVDQSEGRASHWRAQRVKEDRGRDVHRCVSMQDFLHIWRKELVREGFIWWSTSVLWGNLIERYEEERQEWVLGMFVEQREERRCHGETKLESSQTSFCYSPEEHFFPTALFSSEVTCGKLLVWESTWLAV